MTRHSATAASPAVTRLLLRFVPVILLTVAGCALGTALPPPPTAEEIPALREQLALDSASLPLRLRLAEAHRVADQPDAALVLLEPLAEAYPPATFHLALVYEDMGRTADARRLYRSYLELGREGALKNQVRGRLALLERQELEEVVRAAVARERELAGTAPTPRTVGIFPFLAVTEDPALRPIGTALAELLTTDLAQTDRLTVLERTQVQALLDELALAESGRVDPATAARTGRMLGAANLIQGRVETEGAGLVLQAAVVRVPEDAPSDPLREQDALERIFDMEKRLALALYDRLGIQLTSAERERVTRRQTDNVQALLAFGFGLEAADAGRFDEAAGHFARAVNLDPSFALAREEWENSYHASQAATTPLGLLGQLALAEAGPAGNWRGRFAPVEALIVDPSVRDPAAEALGTEGPGRSGTAVIVIRRPGGAP